MGPLLSIKPPMKFEIHKYQGQFIPSDWLRGDLMVMFKHFEEVFLTIHVVRKPTRAPIYAYRNQLIQVLSFKFVITHLSIRTYR